MIPWERVDQGEPGTADSALTLHRRGEEWSIRSGGVELMNNRKTGSERALAERAARTATALEGADPVRRVMIGGLGLGFTARAALDAFPEASLLVVEISPKVIEWNQGALGALAENPLAAARCRLESADVLDALEQAGGAGQSGFDVVLLDVDNGPEALSRPGNDGLYSVRGLEMARRALAPQGLLGVWSAGPSASFEARLKRVFGRFETHLVSPRVGAKGRARHTIWVAGPAAE